MVSLPSSWAAIQDPFGLIEHFADPGEAVRRRCDMVASGGFVVITVPNFAAAQYWLHRWFDAENLAGHNLAAMNPLNLRRWVADQPTSKWRKVVHHRALSAAGGVKKVLAMLGMENRPNRWFGPWLVLVARHAGVANPVVLGDAG